MFCYEVHVKTTNSMNDTFKTDGEYHPCTGGVVYVFAKNVMEAGKQIPEASVVRLVGRAFATGEGTV